MAKHRLKLKQLRRILRSYGVSEDSSRGKGGHTMFWKQFPGGTFTYPVPNKADVRPCYVSGCRRRFKLMPVDGVSDADFFGRG
jgi:hypothetical protein